MYIHRVVSQHFKLPPIFPSPFVRFVHFEGRDCTFEMPLAMALKRTTRTDRPTHEHLLNSQMPWALLGCTGLPPLYGDPLQVTSLGLHGSLSKML